MKAAYELTVLFLRLWMLGLVVIAFVSISDFVFRRPHGLRMLMHRLCMSIVWPLALASTRGRLSLLGKLKEI